MFKILWLSLLALITAQEDYDGWNYYGSEYEYGDYGAEEALYDLAQLPKEVATDCRGKNVNKKMSY